MPSPSSTQATNPKQAKPRTPFHLRDFKRDVGNDPNRLAYRSYRQSKHTARSPEAKERSQPPRPRDKGPFLPLLPLPTSPGKVPRPDEYASGGGGGIQAEPEEGFELSEFGLSFTEPLHRQTSRSPKATKVYTRKKKKPSPSRKDAAPSEVSTQASDDQYQSQQQWHVGGDTSFDEAEPALQDKATSIVEQPHPRKRKRQPQQVFEEYDGVLVMNKRSAKETKRPRRLPVRELALVKSLPSPEMSEEESEVFSAPEYPLVIHGLFDPRSLTDLD